MKRFACGDVIPGCTATWAAPNDEELLELVARHATEAHGVGELPPQLVAEVRSKISVGV